MIEAEARDILKRYRASVGYPVAGQSFGYGPVMFKAEIEKRARARGMSQMHAYLHAERAYCRALKYTPDWKTYQKAVAVVRAIDSPPSAAPIAFTDDELAAIVERFQMANDDIGQSVHAKATALFSR